MQRIIDLKPTGDLQFALLAAYVLLDREQKQAFVRRLVDKPDQRERNDYIFSVYQKHKRVLRERYPSIDFEGYLISLSVQQDT